MGKQNDPNVETIENATAEMIRGGDHLTRRAVSRYRDLTVSETREGVAHHRDEEGNWFTKDGMWVTSDGGDGVALTIRRAVPPLPGVPMSVIVPNDGHENIEATRGGYVWRAREAVLGGDGRWHGVWRTELERGAVSSVYPECINIETCKVDDQ